MWLECVQNFAEMDFVGVKLELYKNASLDGL
jgi:hypothetical protein